MITPWLTLPDAAPFVLDTDRSAVAAANARASADAKLDLTLLPEPYVGDPRVAPVLLLQLNPGLAGGEYETHVDPAFSSVLGRNLRHENDEWPFYYLRPEPAIRESDGARYWRAKLSKVIEACGDAATAHGIAMVEWLPYHSKVFDQRISQAFPSAQYAKALVTAALRDAKRIVICLRARERWVRLLTDAPVERLWAVKNPRNPSLSARNLAVNDVDGAARFDELCSAISHHARRD